MNGEDRDRLLERTAANTEWLRREFEEFKRKAVTQDEFGPVKNLVYGGTSVILLAVMVAIVALVVR